MARKLKNLKVEFISLVKRPATGKGLILKNVDGRVEEIKLTKFDEETRRAYGIVYAPDQVDSQGEYTDAAEIRKAADDFMQNGRMKNVDTNHDFEPKDAFVAEQWLTKENDSMFPDEPLGAWAVGIQVNTDKLWEQVKKGELVGISLAGTAETEPEPGPAQKDETPGWFTKFMNNFQKKDQDMDKEAEKKFNDRLDAIEDTLSKLQKSLDTRDPDDKKTKEPDSKGADVTEAVEKAVLKAKTEILTDMNKTLAEALSKGQSATGTPGQSIESEMV